MDQLFLHNENDKGIHSWSILDFLLATFTCTALVWYTQFLWSRRKLYQASWRLPGPLALPFIGSALCFTGHPDDIFTNIMKLFNHYPGIFRIWVGSRMFYVVSEPKYHDIILTKCLGKHPWYYYAQSAVGHGLFTAPYQKWRRHRKAILPTFNQKILDGFVEIFYEQAQVLVDKLKEVAGKGEFDIFDMVSRCTVDTICETAMGVKVKTQTKDDVPMSTWIERMMEGVFLRIVVLWYHFDAVFNLTGISKLMWKSIGNIHRFSRTVVREKKRSKYPEECNVSRRKAFLDYLIQVTSKGNSEFTETELMDEVNTIIVAGSDTTASTNSFVFLMLGLHQDLQQRVYEEVLEVVGSTREVNQDDLPKLKYLERFIKETLRLFPVAYFIARAVHEDVDLGDHVLPSGTSVIVGILRTHTDEKFWPDPYRFDPDRFLSEEAAKRHPCSYIPFSHGPRNCLGLKYAMMAMKVLLATVIRRFKVTTSYKSVRDVELKANLVLRPKTGFRISLELRLCTTLIKYAQFLWSRKKLYQASWKVPGPLALPFVGSALRLIGDPREAVSKCIEICNQYPTVFKVWIVSRLLYVISEPKYLEIVLVKCLNKDKVKEYRFIKSSMGHGLFTAPVQTWKKHRKLLMPTLNQKILDGFVEVIYRRAETLVDKLKEVSGKGEFDIFDKISKCTVDTFCETFMGVKINTQTTDDFPVVKWVDGIFAGCFFRIVIPWYRIDAIYKLTRSSKKMQACVDSLHRFAVFIVKERKRLLHKAVQENCCSDESSKKPFLDYLLDVTGKPDSKFTEQQLLDEVKTFMIGGTDTSVATNAFAFLMLGLHQDLQQKVYEEVLQVIGTDNEITQEHVPKLKYMDMFIKETLRLFPLAPAVFRDVEEDVNVGDYVLPAGSSVILLIYKTHTDEKLWPEPFKFDPNRFLPEQVAKRHPCAHIPFSYGPRNCIGYKYGMMSLKVIIATVIRRFQFSTSYKSVQDVELQCTMVIRPKNGFRVSLQLRSYTLKPSFGFSIIFVTTSTSSTDL
ncbi:hypothetical protein NQ315_000161 [Exocentrus adspersus]|uniref:Cytochrome P450 n=1 Tax=Exocentrus adspersus TaxID=1586481 RepID=A0AAV8VQS3_9CUCU|nr:hypothetical protein NQ315_000161 [Exocentrus adspersus]